MGKINTTRNQDLKLTEDANDNLTYIEFHNWIYSQPPVEVRAVEYFGLGIGHSGGSLANQIWLLAEDVPSVLYNQAITRYMLIDEVTGIQYPAQSGIMFVSLQKLSQENTRVGELARFLLGETHTPENQDVKKIVSSFNASFEALKADKEVSANMTAFERYLKRGYDEGLYKGKAEGKAEGRAEIALELLKDGMDAAKVAKLSKMPIEWVNGLLAKDQHAS